MPHKPAKKPALDDLYAVGMILYSMISGNSPDKFPSVPIKISSAPGFNEPNKIFCKACERDPESRFQSADEFVSAIDDAYGNIDKNEKNSVLSARKSSSGRSTMAERRNVKTKNKTEEKKMNASVQKIRNAVETMRKYGIQPSERLQKELKNLENPNYKVAVVGKYQVGKSKLINEVFLRNQILIEGEALCTTAVGTEVCYGKEKKLSVYKWIKTEEDMTVEIDGKPKTEKITVKKENNRSEDKPNPTREDICLVTIAKKEERTKLSDEIQAVKLFWPAESLKRYTIYDTPGVDDPNQELLINTTYRIIPESDVAILVVNCEMLGEVNLNFLTSRIFDKAKGLSRIMVLVSHRANKGKIAAEIREGILNQIKSDLETIGRGHLPVNMICYDSSIDGEILNNPDQIEKAIIDYLDKNVEAGRIEKISMIVLQELYDALKQIGTKLAFADKSESERRKLFAEIQGKETELRGKYDEIASDICNEIMDLKRDIVPAFRNKLLNAMEEYASGFNTCADVAAAQDRLDKASILLKPEVEKIVFDIRDEAKEKTKEIVQKYKEKMVSVTNAWNELLDFEFKIDGGILSRIPAEIITILDYILSILILPGGPILNIIERFIAEKIPFIKKFIPGNIIKAIMINCITNAIRGQQNEISRKLNEKFDLAFGNVKIEIKKEFERAFTKEVQAIKETAEKSVAISLSPEQKSALLNAKAAIESEIRNPVLG